MINPRYVAMLVLVARLPLAGQSASRDVEIIGRDYAFVAPHDLPAGQTTFRFSNKGSVIHELHIALLNPGVTDHDVMNGVRTRTVNALTESAVGILLATAGHRSQSSLSTNLLPGRAYVVICRLRNGDVDTMPMHSQLGMVTVIHTSSTMGPAAPLARIDTIVGMDYAFNAPATLGAGRHTILFVNRGAHKHEINIARLRRGSRSRGRSRW